MNKMADMKEAKGIRFDEQGLIPAVVQDWRDGTVLMVGFMNQDALDHTLKTKHVHFWSRSRRALWKKGETSGNFLHVEEIRHDCASDTILIKARPSGPVCHTGKDTCFDEGNESENFLLELEALIKDRKAAPKENSYTSKLFSEGLNRIAQKVGEEAVELVIESKDSDNERFKGEAADLLYHLLVLFAEKDIELKDVLDTLRQRRH